MMLGYDVRLSFPSNQFPRLVGLGVPREWSGPVSRLGRTPESLTLGSVSGGLLIPNPPK